MIHFLSHVLGEDTPAYGGAKSQIEISSEKSMNHGDSSDTFRVSLSNHYGTHVDCPAHFFKGGFKVADAKADFWRFNSPQVIPVRLKPGELLSEKVVARKIKKNTDLVLFKSGWSSLRTKREYSQKNPGINASVGRYIRAKHPKVRAIGMDWISVSSYLNREAGRAAHRAFLDPKAKGRPIVLIEDMDLKQATAKLKQVLVVPLRIAEIDSAPCTVLGYS